VPVYFRVDFFGKFIQTTSALFSCGDFHHVGLDSLVLDQRLLLYQGTGLDMPLPIARGYSTTLRLLLLNGQDYTFSHRDRQEQLMSILDYLTLCFWDAENADERRFF
jgi:hypothetical protein